MREKRTTSIIRRERREKRHPLRCPESKANPIGKTMKIREGYEKVWVEEIVKRWLEHP